MKSLILLISLLLITVIDTFAQDGAPDPAFGGGDGMVLHTITNNEKSWGYGVAVQPDQKIVVTGNTIGYDGYEQPFLARYQEDGMLDSSFNGNGKVLLDLSAEHSYGRAVRIQPDGKIVLCAESDDSTGKKIWVLRFNEDGTPDASFDIDGLAKIIVKSKYLGVKALALQADNKIVVGGYLGGLARDSFFIARFLSNGMLDNSFDGDGFTHTIVGEDYINVGALLVQPDNKIIAVGYARFGGNDDMTLVRYNDNGTLDNSFSGDGIAHIKFSDGDDSANSGLIQPDGKIVVAGYAINDANGKKDFAIARFNPDGTLDDSFQGNGMTLIHITEFSDAAYTLLRQPDGKYLMGGLAHSETAAGGSALALARLNENGTFDNTFDDDGIFSLIHPGISTVIFSAAMQPDGKIISAGTFNDGGINQVMLFRTLTGLTTATHDVEEVVVEVSLYPNPVSEILVLKYSLQKTEQLQITLCDVMGRKIDQLLNQQERHAGNHEELLKLNKAFSPGLYFVKMETGRGVKVIPIVKE